MKKVTICIAAVALVFAVLTGYIAFNEQPVLSIGNMEGLAIGEGDDGMTCYCPTGLFSNRRCLASNSGGLCAYGYCPEYSENICY